MLPALVSAPSAVTVLVLLPGPDGPDCPGGMCGLVVRGWTALRLGLLHPAQGVLCLTGLGLVGCGAHRASEARAAVAGVLP